MKTEQCVWTGTTGWQKVSGDNLHEEANLVLVFGSREVLSDDARFHEVRSRYPNARLMLGTTAGEILGTEVLDDSCTVTAIHFEHTPLEFAEVNIDDVGSSLEAGKRLALALPHEDLVHVFVLSDGQKVNGSALVEGFYANLPKTVTTTGGLAGDAARFTRTLVGLDRAPAEGNIVAVGLYGSHIRVGHGSMGGWDPFGAQRLITRAEKNVLYELDGRSALELYKMYLGDQAEGLPGTALLFPLSISMNETDGELVRTVLSVDEATQSMTFAGDMPVGAYARLMKANLDRLVDAASTAATESYHSFGDFKPELAILISCVGRKLVLDQRVEEEVENVRDVLGDQATLTGFYSYGEISPFNPATRCELHNQTMTITTLAENGHVQ
ncbi:MAG: FIST signal transduction protein [Rhodothermales bacterium]